MTDLLIKFPTRARPDKFTETLGKYQRMLSGKWAVRFLITVDHDDPTMNSGRMLARLRSDPRVEVRVGNARSKIEAVNAHLEGQDFRVLLLASDDMIPQVQGYDDVILSEMSAHFSDTDGALWFEDGRKSAICTLSILGRKLFDRFGYIYHPDYVSLWCDNEFTEVVTAMGKMARLPQVIISHEWTNYTGTDKLHRRNESFFRRDQQTYERRKAAGFPGLKSPA
jgi:hypothetical protein